MLHISLSIHARQRHVRGLKFENIWKFLKLVYLAFSYLWIIYKFLVFEVEIFQKLVKSIIKLNSGGIGRGLIGWPANPPPPLPCLEKQSRESWKRLWTLWQKLRQTLLDSYFIIISTLWHLLVFYAVTIFNFRFQFSNCNFFFDVLHWFCNHKVPVPPSLSPEKRKNVDLPLEMKYVWICKALRHTEKAQYCNTAKALGREG